MLRFLSSLRDKIKVARIRQGCLVVVSSNGLNSISQLSLEFLRSLVSDRSDFDSVVHPEVRKLSIPETGLQTAQHCEQFRVPSDLEVQALSLCEVLHKYYMHTNDTFSRNRSTNSNLFDEVPVDSTRRPSKDTVVVV